MQEQTYKKGHILVWVGFLGAVLFNALKIFAQPDLAPNLIPLVPLFSLIGLIFVVVLIWGAYLVLKSKNRSWAWLLLIIPLNIIGVVVLFSLKDKTLATVQTHSSPKL